MGFGRFLLQRASVYRPLVINCEVMPDRRGVCICSSYLKKMEFVLIPG